MQRPSLQARLVPGLVFVVAAEGVCLWYGIVLLWRRTGFVMAPNRVWLKRRRGVLVGRDKVLLVRRTGVVKAPNKVRL